MKGMRQLHRVVLSEVKQSPGLRIKDVALVLGIKESVAYPAVMWLKKYKFIIAHCSKPNSASRYYSPVTKGIFEIHAKLESENADYPAGYELAIEVSEHIKKAEELEAKGLYRRALTAWVDIQILTDSVDIVAFACRKRTTLRAKLGVHQQSADPRMDYELIPGGAL